MLQALQAQLLQRLAVSGAPSLAHISRLPQQTAVSSNGLSPTVQLLQPVASISSSQQRLQVMTFSEENSSVQQQSANGDRCLNSSEDTGRRCSHSSQLPTESCHQNSLTGLSHSTSVDILQSGRDVSEAAEPCIESQPAGVSQPPQLGQSTNTDDHSGSQNLLPVPACTQSTSHSHVIKQLQHQLLQSSARQTVNGCRVAAAVDNHQPAGEEGEVDSNELMQFLS